MNAHYTRRDLCESLARLPLACGDVVFSHSNLGFFGRADSASNSCGLCECFFDAIMSALGGKGTLVVPTFTYSFPRKELFDPENTASSMGTFAEWIRTHPDSHRSDDPCYSVAAIGEHAVELTTCVPENSFGPGSFFDRFYRIHGKVLNLNFDAGSTFIHYVERCFAVPYRFDKTFHGQLAKRGETTSATSTIWVRYLSDDALEFDSKPFSRLASEKGLFRQVPLGRGQVGAISACDTYALIQETLPLRPWFLTKAESLGIRHPNIVSE